MAIPYENEVGLSDQSYAMMTARNLAEMKQALSHLQLMAQNIMVATVQGDIYYLRNGRVPIRAAGVDPSRPIPGSTPCCSTSLMRLMRRSTRNTPSGGAATDSARQPASARRMKPNANGETTIS